MILFFGLDQKITTCDPILHFQSQNMTMSIHPFSLTIFGWENPESISSAPHAKQARTFLFSLNSETQQGKRGADGETDANMAVTFSTHEN